jgi:hypothetical protein
MRLSQVKFAAAANFKVVAAAGAADGWQKQFFSICVKTVEILTTLRHDNNLLHNFDSTHCL